MALQEVMDLAVDAIRHLKSFQPDSRRAERHGARPPLRYTSRKADIQHAKFLSSEIRIVSIVRHVRS